MKAHFTATARTISVRITTLVMTLIMALTLALPASAAANETNITTPSGIPLSEIDARIADLVNQHIGTTTPGAAVAVIQNGEIVSLQNFGYAHLADEIPVNNQSVFEYGSISKLFTYTAAMQLVEQGKLDLDTDIREYFSAEFAQQWPHTQTVTMRDLMNHAGGFGDFPFSTLELSPDNIVSLEETLLNQHPQQYFTPGTASSYSNFGTALAGYIVESIVGKPFYQIQQEMIFEPAGMTLAAG
ncbi:MAG: beta-lactamase family protein, partial [Coriobacteriia bacterium]|nr:beta-lactamase family protein [Coriobacteriia bacterium]